MSWEESWQNELILKSLFKTTVEAYGFCESFTPKHWGAGINYQKNAESVILSSSCLGKWDRSWWWVKRHLFSLHILLWEWNTEGIEAQHKFRFHCSPKLCLSCICQDGVWNSSNIKKVIFLHKWDNDEICGFSGFPASPSLESWVLITWAGARERYQEGSIHPLSCMMPALRSKKIYFFTPFFPILSHWGELFLSFCWGNKKRRRKRILQRKHRCCRFLLCLKRSLNLLHLLL